MNNAYPQGGEAGMTCLDEATLERWLRAENFDVDKAEKRLRAHALWRRDEFPEGKVLEVSTHYHPQAGFHAQFLARKWNTLLMLQETHRASIQ